MLPVLRPDPAQTLECQPDDSAWGTVIRVLDRKTVARLQAALGGKDFKVPKRAQRLHEDHPLVAAIGIEAAIALSQAMGGERLYVRRHLIDPHYDDIRALIADGLSNPQIADRLRMGERQVRSLCRMYGLVNPNIHRSVSRLRLPAPEQRLIAAE